MVVEMKDFSANGSHQNQIEECDSSTSFTGFSGVSSSVATPGVTGVCVCVCVCVCVLMYVFIGMYIIGVLFIL